MNEGYAPFIPAAYEGEYSDTPEAARAPSHPLPRRRRLPHPQADGMT